MKALLALLVALPLLSLSVTGCKEESDTENKMEDVMEGAEENMEDAGEATEDAVDDAGDSMEDMGEDAAETMDDATE